MSLANNFTYLSSFDGIVALAVQSPDGTAITGLEPWATVAQASIRLLSVGDDGDAEDEAKVYAGKHLISVVRIGDEIAAAAIVAGHPVVKSWRRTLRKAARRDGPPRARVVREAIPAVAPRPRAPALEPQTAALVRAAIEDRPADLPEASAAIYADPGDPPESPEPGPSWQTEGLPENPTRPF